MSEEEQEKKAIKKMQWFGDLVENLPTGKGESFTDKVIALESAKVVTAASQEAIRSVTPQPEKSGVEKGVTKALEKVAEEAVAERFSDKKDTVTEKVMGVIGETTAEMWRERLSGGGGRASEAELELAKIHRADELKAMFQQFNTEVVAPLQEQVKELAAKKEENGGKMTVDSAVDMVMNAQERAKKLLEGAGFNVESVNVSKAEVTKMIKEEEKKYNERLEKEKEEWEKDKGATVEIESKRIEATENFLSTLTDRFFGIFLEPLRDEIHKAIKSGAFQRQPPRT